MLYSSLLFFYTIVFIIRWCVDWIVRDGKPLLTLIVCYNLLWDFIKLLLSDMIFNKYLIRLCSKTNLILLSCFFKLKEFVEFSIVFFKGSVFIDVGSILKNIFIRLKKESEKINDHSNNVAFTWKTNLVELFNFIVFLLKLIPFFCKNLFTLRFYLGFFTMFYFYYCTTNNFIYKKRFHFRYYIKMRFNFLWDKVYKSFSFTDLIYLKPLVFVIDVIIFVIIFRIYTTNYIDRLIHHHSQFISNYMTILWRWTVRKRYYKLNAHRYFFYAKYGYWRHWFMTNTYWYVIVRGFWLIRKKSWETLQIFLFVRKAELRDFYSYGYYSDEIQGFANIESDFSFSSFFDCMLPTLTYLLC